MIREHLIDGFPGAMVLSSGVDLVGGLVIGWEDDPTEVLGQYGLIPYDRPMSAELREEYLLIQSRKPWEYADLFGD